MDNNIESAGIRVLLRELAANILRIAAKRGTAGAVVRQAANYGKAVSQYDGRPIDEASALDVIRFELPRLDMTEQQRHWNDMHNAEEHVIQCALRIAAARLMGQATQESVNEHDMAMAMVEWHKARDAANRPAPPPPVNEAARAMEAFRAKLAKPRRKRGV